MPEQTKRIRVETTGATMIVTPSDNLGELEFDEFEPETRAVCKQYEQSKSQNLIVDLHNAEFLGSSTVGWLLELRKVACSRRGRMVLCGVSPTAYEVLTVTHLADRWPTYASREQAIASIAV